MIINEAKIIEALDKYDQLNKKYGPLSENVNVVIEMILGEKKIEINIPEYNTTEFINFLLVNALRCLTEEQRHALTVALMVRDGKILEMIKKLDDDVDTIIKLGFEIKK